MKTLKGEKLIKVMWKDVREGDIVYLYAYHQGKEYGVGPHQVIHPIKRELKSSFTGQYFLHYPEELYRLKL